MKITQSAKGFTLFASKDELRMLATGMTEFTPAPEERGLARKVLQQLTVALPDEDENDDDADLYEKEPAGDKGDGDDDDDI